MRYLILAVIFGTIIFSCSNEKKGFYSEEGMNFHFDLNESGAKLKKDLFLVTNGQKHLLVKHDDDSYELLINEYDALDYVQKDELTHYASGVKIKENSVNHIFLTEGDPHFDPDHRLILSTYYIAREPVLRASSGLKDNNVKVCAVSKAVSMVFNHPELLTSDPEKAEIIMKHINPVDQNMLCDKNAHHRPEIIDLAIAINTAEKNGGSVVNEPITVYSETEPDDESEKNVYWVKEPDDTESLIFFKDGNPFYVYKLTDDEEPAPIPFTGDISTKSPAVQYRPVDDVLNAVTPALLVAMNETKNDPILENVKYSMIKGDGPSETDSVIEIPDEEINDDEEMPDDDTVVLKTVLNSSGEKITLSKTGGIDGMSIYLNSDEIETDEKGFRYMTVKVKNYYLRHVTLWTKWKKIDGTADFWWKKYLNDPNKDDSGLSPDFFSVVGLPSWYAFFNDMASVKDSVFWGFVSNRAVMMGIPLSPDWSYFKIPIPPTSSKAELIFASMGTGKWQNENIPGAILTSVMDLGIPAYFLVSGAVDGVGGKPILKDALTNPKVITTIIALGISMGIYGEAHKKGANNYAPYAKALGSILVNTGCDRLRYAIVKIVAKNQAEHAIPFVGWGLYIAGLAANVSQLAQTVAEVSSTRAIHNNSLVATWSPKVRITPDPLNIRGGFPESAVKYEAYVHFSDHDTKHLTGKTGNTAVPYLDFTFPDIPEGGSATIKINLLSESGFVAGYVDHEITNTLKSAPADKNGVNYTVQITENMVNITDKTEYFHKDRIGLDKNGHHVWLGYADTNNDYVAPSAPEKTVSSLNCSSTESGLCSINDITLSIKGHSAAYTWQSFSDNTASCSDSKESSGQRYFTENISLLNNKAGGPQSLLIESGCSYIEYRPAVAYSLTGEIDGYNVFVYPEQMEGTTVYPVKKVKIDKTMLFDKEGPVSGYLNLPPTDTAIHPSGYLVSINRDMGKMEVLDLKNDPGILADSEGANFVSGKGDREGLLENPVSVAISQSGDIYVLEQGSFRVSAFDINGSVRQIFGDEEELKNYFDISGLDTSAVLLDIDVESTGLIYVLHYVNGGKTKDDYFVQIYSKDGKLINTNNGIAAAKMAVDHFRNIFTLNYETIVTDITEKPSVSMWIPLP